MPPASRSLMPPPMSVIGASTGQTAQSSNADSQHSLRQLVRTQITEYSRLVQSLFSSLDIVADGRPIAHSPTELVKQIVNLDATLMGAVEKTVEAHQQQQRKIVQIQHEIEEQNKAIMEVIQTLQGAKDTLEASLEGLEEKKAAVKEAREAEISVNEIVSYASRLSNYTSAPPNFDPANATQQFEPPYPREIIMRAGLLNQQHIPAAQLIQLDADTGPAPAGAAGAPRQTNGHNGLSDHGVEEFEESDDSEPEETSLFGKIHPVPGTSHDQEEPEENDGGGMFDLDLNPDL
ncbi:hypothetical protein BGZ73_001679 [Actinomortierella ambigua]|nr:hypothetical protein BGZ73_001679 [Actinomortierella ambigua]